MKRILVVDDEVQILKAMSRLFMEKDYEILTAESGSQALTLLADHDIDLIISDMRMPLMSGNDLLYIVKEKYPHIIRVILSGYADEKSMFQALLHNVAKLYIFKPWNNNELVQNLERLFATDALINSPDLTALLNDIQYRVEIPQNCQKLIDLIDQEDLDALIGAIEKDAEISALLMHVAKCSIYGAMPNSVKLVANYLGLQNLKSFVYWASLTVTDPKSGLEDNDLAILWKQSCDTNRILLFLYEAFLHKQPPDAALFAGLLKNIGYIILLRSNIHQYREYLKQNDEKSHNLITLENEKFKFTHQEVGAYFLNLWDLPYPAVEVALYHHRPLDPNIVNTELLACVHIAQHYSWKILNGGEGTELLPEVFNRIGISLRDFEVKLFKYLK
ncbi:MAG: putative signal transduction protein [Herbinix sp.]|jgi:HD-like signal output (HDOD) protein/CheY-like chemotaxis protein|nr:putative signal transduction protein [Herbinix sp.]